MDEEYYDEYYDEYDEYEDDDDYEEYDGIRRRTGIIILIVSVLLAAAVGVLAYFLLRKPPEDEEVERMGYAKGAVVESGITIVDEATMQEAVDFLFLEEEAPEISLQYRNNPKSTDGNEFVCHIANSADNLYDMYIAIYSDGGCTDELFRSERLTPGTVLDGVTLERTLEEGVHELTVAFIQVEDDSEEVRAQTLITMDFTVS